MIARNQAIKVKLRKPGSLNYGIDGDADMKYN